MPLNCAVALAALGIFAAAMCGFMKSSDAYAGALARARSSQAVANALGSPIADGFLIQGNINVSGDSGQAELTIPVSGPKGRGSISVEASKRLGAWHFDRMIVEVEATRQRIDLSEKPGTYGQAPP